MKSNGTRHRKGIIKIIRVDTDHNLVTVQFPKSSRFKDKSSKSKNPAPFPGLLFLVFLNILNEKRDFEIKSLDIG